VIVLVVVNAKPGLRGHVTRWLSEPAPGVYVGSVSTRVRDRLWATVARRIGTGYAVLLEPDHAEQRWRVETAGLVSRIEPVDFDGLTLFRRRRRSAQSA
jgi:CRISPR-associated protein Cas2